LRRGGRNPEPRRAASRIARTPAIATAPTLRTVSGPALNQTEGLVGSAIELPGLDLAVPGHSTLGHRTKMLDAPPCRQPGTGPLHLLVDSTRLKLSGAGGWPVEKHGTSRRRYWRKPHIGIDAGSGEIVAVGVTRKEINDVARTGALPDRLADPLASFTADGRHGATAACGSSPNAPGRRPTSGRRAKAGVSKPDGRHRHASDGLTSGRP